MTLKTEDSEILNTRDALTPAQRQAIDDSMEAIAQTFRLYDLPAAGDDRQAQLEAALMRYMAESRIY